MPCDDVLSGDQYWHMTRRQAGNGQSNRECSSEWTILNGKKKDHRRG